MPPPSGLFMPPRDMPPGMLPADMVAIAAIGRGWRSSSKIRLGFLQEKSSISITTSCRPLRMAACSRTISGAASRFCSCRPKCECIQRVPAGWAGKL